jgi:hypothetical protein
MGRPQSRAATQQGLLAARPAQAPASAAVQGQRRRLHRRTCRRCRGRSTPSQQWRGPPATPTAYRRGRRARRNGRTSACRRRPLTTSQRRRIGTRSRRQLRLARITPRPPLRSPLRMPLLRPFHAPLPPTLQMRHPTSSVTWSSYCDAREFFFFAPHHATKMPPCPPLQHTRQLCVSPSQGRPAAGGATHGCSCVWHGAPLRGAPRSNAQLTK